MRHKTVHLNWSAPEYVPFTPDIEYYIVTVTDGFNTSEHNTSDAANQMEVYELRPFHNYTFQVFAVNRMGIGPASELVAEMIDTWSK